MAQIIHFDDDIIPADELKLMQTKQAILAKLRVRFGEFPPGGGWPAMRKPDTVTIAENHAALRRG
jgi:hypothetical protein